MNILMVATKCPWPPIDGGRLLLLEEIAALAAADTSITLVAPCPRDQIEKARAALLEIGPIEVRLVPTSRAPTSLWAKLLGSVDVRLAWEPYSSVRHRQRRVQRCLADLLQQRSWDIVHAEQVQSVALLPMSLTANSSPRRSGSPCLVVRCQNVESDLWLQLARLEKKTLPGKWGTFWWLLRPLLSYEARRLQKWEVGTLQRARRALPLTREDHQRFLQLGVDAMRLRAIAAPFPSRLPSREGALSGQPALVLLGSGGWLPNRIATDEFLEQVWPRIHDALPDARLHWFGAPERTGQLQLAHTELGIVHHGRVEDTKAMFDPSSTLLVPLSVASGVRIKILDAWARGVPVVASSIAARGLERGHATALRVADSAQEWISAIKSLQMKEQRCAAVAAGRTVLENSHDARDVANLLLGAYRDCPHDDSDQDCERAT